MKHRTLKTMLAAVLILCTLLPLPAANAKTKYTVEVKKTDVEADLVINTEGYASLTKKYRLSEEEKKEAYRELNGWYLEDGETVEEYLEKNGFEDIEEYYLDGEYTSSYFGDDRALMDKNGKIIMPYIYAVNPYIVSDGIISKGNEGGQKARIDVDSDGYYDLNGNRLFEEKYSVVHPFNDGVAYVRIYDQENKTDPNYIFSGSTSYLIDKKGNIILEFHEMFDYGDGVGDSGFCAFITHTSSCSTYSENLIGFVSSHRFKDTIYNVQALYTDTYLVGYMDINGNIIIPQEYYAGGSFHSGMAWVQDKYTEEHDIIANEFVTKGGKFGYINKTGELVIPYIYDDVTDFDGEYASAQKDGKWGLINKKGETIIPFEYDDLYIYDGIITCVKDQNINSPLVLMTVEQEVIWQLDADSVDTTSTYDDGVLYYIKDGYVHVVTVTAEEEKDGVMGDADGNGKITAADARYSLRASVGLETVTEELLALLDVNKDKAVTAADARLILRASVGLEDHTKW